MVDKVEDDDAHKRRLWRKIARGVIERGFGVGPARYIHEKVVQGSNDWS